MAKVKLAAGMEIDTLTQKELADTLKSWQVELVKGMRPVLFDASGTIAGNAISIGGSSGDTRSGRLGPRDGYVWSIARVASTGLAVATDPTSLFVGDNEPGRLLFPNFTGTANSAGYKAFGKAEGLLFENQRLLLASTGAVASTGLVTLAGLALELPIGMLWQLV